METCVFTLCSINYLAYAKILGDSLLKFNPNLKFIIGLVDVIECNIDLSEFSSFEIIEIAKIDVPCFEEKIINYEITELSTALKPSFFKYLFGTNKDLMKIIYLDPDIMVFDKLTPILGALDQFNAVLTPHIINPMEDTEFIDEGVFLRYGLYNLGFIALKRSDSAFSLLDWWERKLLYECRKKPKHGLWVDQKWMDLSPIFFDKISISKHPGLNVSWWNEHERHMTKKDNRFFVNNKYPLIFFHFGAMSFEDKNKHKWRKGIVTLFERYETLLIANNHNYWGQVECHYAKLHEISKKSSQQLNSNLNLAKRIGMRLLKFLEFIIYKARKTKNKEN